jgi:2-haloacid dehalogenase
MSELGSLKALAFDVGGTVLDWHGGIVEALSALGRQKSLEADWPRVTNAWRMATLKEMLGEDLSGQRTGPLAELNIDGVHRALIDPVLDEFGIEGIAEAEKDDLALAWHRLSPWPDAVAGHARLRQKFRLSTLTILSVALIVDVSRHAPFLWDAVISCEMLGVYKPDPRVYRRGAELLALEPAEIMLVAAHNIDLTAAAREGYRTAFIRRPSEWGPDDTPEPQPDPVVDLVADGLDDLAAQLAV